AMTMVEVRKHFRRKPDKPQFTPSSSFLRAMASSVKEREEHLGFEKGELEQLSEQTARNQRKQRPIQDYKPLPKEDRKEVPTEKQKELLAEQREAELAQRKANQEQAEAKAKV